MTAAFTFPGQGSQAVGMGKALAEAFPVARAVFDEVDAALGEKLTAVIWDGPGETLQLTENAQPALMAVSIATLRVLETEAGFSVGRDAAFVAGHSLGEYSALAAAGSLTIADTARLLRTRGLAMQKAVPVGAGAMARCSASPEAAVRSQARGRPGPVARPPTTMAADRWWCPATRPRSTARSKSPRARAPSALCCCRCRPPFIAN
jgi:[acyl-carrier-protein] S-malonyltransferase